MTTEDRAFILAPLITPFAFVIGAQFLDMQFGLIGSFLFITVFGLPIVYTIEFFLGYRFYRLFLKLKKLNIFSVAMGGMILANIPTLFIALFQGFGSQEIPVSTIFYLFTFVGFCISMNFWVLLHWNKITKKN